MSDSLTTYQSAIDNIKPEAKRLEALRKVIEIGGLDRDLMIELRRQYLDLTDKGERA